MSEVIPIDPYFVVTMPQGLTMARHERYAWQYDFITEQGKAGRITEWPEDRYPYVVNDRQGNIIGVFKYMIEAVEAYLEDQWAL